MSKNNQSPIPNLSLWRMGLLALLVGVIGGLGAWVFRMIIGLIHNAMFLGEFSAYYDANVHTPAGSWGAWVILSPIVGGLVVAFLVKNFAPEAKGHGVPEVMDAIHYNRGLIRPRVAIVKSLASAISIGSGGAVGREGPIIQIGSAFGSMCGQFIAMPARQRIVLIAAGAGAGIAATFNAPLGGTIFAVELLLLSVNAINILLVAIAVVTATYLGRMLIGADPSFNIPALALPDFHLEQGWALALFFPLGCLIGVVCPAFIRLLYWSEDRFESLPGNYYSRHALGMACVGLLMYALMVYQGHYYVQGVGYATIADILTGVLGDPGFLLLLFVLKLFATCLSLGSGASGGVFSPALFMGATAGAAYGKLLLLVFPSLDIGTPGFAIAGMAAAIGGSTGAVLTGITMIYEMTRDYNAILPIIITVATAYGVRKTLMAESIYTLKLIRRGNVVPEGLQSAFSASERITDLMQQSFAVRESGEAQDPDNEITIFSERGLIEKVCGIHWHIHGIPVGNPVNLPFAVVGHKSTLLETLQALQHSEAKIALISRSPGLRRAEDVVGVIGLSDISLYFCQQASLL